jgi:hypothetical protein
VVEPDGAADRKPASPCTACRWPAGLNRTLQSESDFYFGFLLRNARRHWEEQGKFRLAAISFCDYGLSSAVILDSVKSNSRSIRRSTSSFMRPSSRS